MEMFRSLEFHPENGRHRRLLKPRKNREWYKKLFVSDQQPKPCCEIFVTSTVEVRAPGAPDFMFMLRYD